MPFRSSSGGGGRAAQYARWNEVRRRTGYRSRFEADIAETLKGTGAVYESARLPYSVTLTATYKPDWLLPDQCIVLEAKGELDKADRDKMQLIRQQYPTSTSASCSRRPTPSSQKPSRKRTGARKPASRGAEVRGFPTTG